MSRLRRYGSGLFAFVPFLVMLALHRWFGLSNKFLAAPAPGERFWPSYNPLMVLAFYAGQAVCGAWWIWTFASGPVRGGDDR